MWTAIGVASHFLLSYASIRSQFKRLSIFTGDRIAPARELDVFLALSFWER
jgi:hypothetical protein